MIYDRPTKTLMKQFADETLQKGQVFSKKDAVKWFREKYPNIKTNTVEMNVEIMAVNNPSNLPSSWRTLRAYFKHLCELGMLGYSGNSWFRVLSREQIRATS